MPFPLIPVAIGGIVVVGLIAALKKPAPPDETTVVHPDEPGPPVPPTPPGEEPGIDVPDIPGDPGWIPSGVGEPPRALIAGPASDPEIAALLAEIDDMLDSAGVGKYTSAKELTVMPKAPGRPFAIPPRALWPNIIPTMQRIQELRETLGYPLIFRGYRDPSYNKAVGGASGSLHQWFSGVDMYVKDGGTTRKRQLGRETAKLYLKYGTQDNMGFGAYGEPTPSNTHIDTGWKKRTWRDAQYYINRVANS